MEWHDTPRSLMHEHAFSQFMLSIGQPYVCLALTTQGYIYIKRDHHESASSFFSQRVLIFTAFVSESVKFRLSPNFKMIL